MSNSPGAPCVKPCPRDQNWHQGPSLVDEIDSIRVRLAEASFRAIDYLQLHYSNAKETGILQLYAWWAVLIYMQAMIEGLPVVEY